jgi:hypothetical protein
MHISRQFVGGFTYEFYGNLYAYVPTVEMCEDSYRRYISGSEKITDQVCASDLFLRKVESVLDAIFIITQDYIGLGPIGTEPGMTLSFL